MEELDRIVFAEISKLAIDPSGYTVNCQLTEEQNNNDLILAEIGKIEKQVENLIDLYAVGGIPKDALQRRITELTEQKEQLEGTLKQEQPNEGLEASVVAQLAGSLAEVLEHGTYEAIRLIITTLIKKIVIDDEDITIYWNIS